MRFARKLMDEYNIAESAVFMDRSSRVEVVDAPGMEKHTFDYWEKQTAVVCEIVCDVRGYTRRSKQGQSVHFVGTPRDVAIASEFYTTLLITIKTMARQTCGNGWMVRHRSYCMGFVDALVEKARAERDRPAEAGTTAIVLRKNEIIDQWMAEHLRLGEPDGNPNAMDHASYSKGHHHGSQMDLGVENRLKGSGGAA